MIGTINQRTPRVIKYNWFTASLEKVISASEPYYVIPSGVSLGLISTDRFNDVEKARPGYSRTAAMYLQNGHVGMGILMDGTLVGMGWYYCNNSLQRKRASYYPLEPGHTWFHAVWVHPSHRGKGFQRLLNAARSRDLLAQVGSTVIETNISPNNQFSQTNALACGFVQNGKILHIKIAGFHWIWKRVTNR